MISHNMNVSHRVAVIDIGSNSVRLIIADKIGNGLSSKINPVATGREATRLIQGMDKLLTESAISRTAEAVCRFAKTAESYDAKCVAFATSAVRDAQNADAFLKAVSGCGISVDVLSGQREAYVALAGARSVAHEAYGKCAFGVMDIGGGSFEFISSGTKGSCGIAKSNGTGEKLGINEAVEAVEADINESVGASMSLPLGAVRIMQTYGNHGEEFLAESVNAAREHAETLLLPLAKTFSGLKWVGVGGSITAIAAIDMGLEEPVGVTGHVITRESASRWLERMCTDPFRSDWKGMQKDRVDILPYGLASVLTAMEIFNIESLVCSESDNLVGYLLAYSE